MLSTGEDMSSPSCSTTTATTSLDQTTTATNNDSKPFLDTEDTKLQSLGQGGSSQIITINSYTGENGNDAVSSNGLDPCLPKDPRLWNRDDVRSWANYLSLRHDLPEIASERFLMNGKALCLMNLNMFCYRVPLGGKLMFKDFQIRLSSAIYQQSLQKQPQQPEKKTSGGVVGLGATSRQLQRLKIIRK